MAKRTTLEERFWAKVDVRGQGECWTWRGARTRAGYGELNGGARGTGMLYAHRVSYEMHFGPIAAGLFVCHRCDVRECVAPHHLFLGTAADNNRDMLAKGRHSREGQPGESNGFARLTEDDVRAIRTRYTGARGEMTALAREFGVTLTNVSLIVKRKAWPHVA